MSGDTETRGSLALRLCAQACGWLPWPSLASYSRHSLQVFSTRLCFYRLGKAAGTGFCHLPGEKWLLTTLAESLSDHFPSLGLRIACRKAKDKVEVLLL